MVMRKSKISLIKQGFFNKSLKGNDYFSFMEDDFDLNLLQGEFSTLYQLFIANNTHWLKNCEVVAYMYYLCNLMILYYQNDYVRADLEKLRVQRQEIEVFIKENFSLEEQKSITQFSDGLKTNTLDDPPSLISISKVRRHISILNTNRSHWGYSRALANHAIIYLQKNCGPIFVSADIINLLNKSREPLALLGILLYTLRFFIHLVLLIKHIVQAAINKELSVKNVLKQEIKKRGFTMVSDMVWAVVTSLTTFNNFFQISASAVSPIIMIFLAFDALIFIIQWTTDTTQYKKHLQELMTQKNEATGFELAIINRQIDLLNDQWEVQCAYYLLNILAANILVISFGLSIICSGPIVLACLALFSMLGNALYNASEEYKKYQHSRIAVWRETSNGIKLNDEHHQKLVDELNRECSQACADFWKTLAYNVGGTAFIITAAVVSWPIALSITLTYMTYRLHHAYQQKSEEPEISHDIYRLFHPEQSESPILGLS